VKKHQSYWVLLFAVLFSGTLEAEVNHYIGGFANVGEWSLLPSESKYSMSFGVTGGLGFVYELQAGSKYSHARFLFDAGVGANYGWTSFSQSAAGGDTLFNQWDQDPYATPRMELDYIYEMRDRHDEYTDLSLQIPLMIGIQYHKFYALAGVKVYPHVLTQTHSKAILTTYGKSKYFIGDFRDDATLQYFTDLPIESSVKTSLKLDLDASLEIGGRFNWVTDDVGFDVPKSKIEYRLAGFVDYGILDVHYDLDGSALGTPKTYTIDPTKKTNPMIDNLVMNDIMSTRGFASKVTNLIVGLKFTVLFQLPKEGECVICKDGYRSLARRRGSGRRGMQYEE